MANEITELGQFATYGGPQLTLAGSNLANQLTSLLTREGSGAGRGWRLFDPAKADFLNTKKVLNPGDVVLVNAKTLPMDFPVQGASASGGSDELVCPVADAAGPCTFAFATGSRFTLSEPVCTPEDPAPTYMVKLGQGAFGPLAQFNAAVAALTDAQVATNGIQFTIQLTPASTAAVTAAFTATY